MRKLLLIFKLCFLVEQNIYQKQNVKPQNSKHYVNKLKSFIVTNNTEKGIRGGRVMADSKEGKRETETNRERDRDRQRGRKR